uniref:BCAS3 domain-containing protein n=1 Tax=Meloidogyne incognita TaxID=6306 RepID=A0A914LKU2_MELIC
MPNKNDKIKKDDNHKFVKNVNKNVGGVLLENGSTNNLTANFHHSPKRIKGKPITKKSTLTDSVAGFVNEVITNVNSTNEPIKWAKIQNLQTGLKGKDSTLIVIIIGLARGYQIYFMENGEFEEIISVRNAPLKDGLLLPFNVEGVDSLSTHRPIFASIFEEYSSDGNTLNFISLSSGETWRRDKFDTHIAEIDFSSNCFLVLLAEIIIIYNNNDLIERLRVKIPKMLSSLCLWKHSLLSCGFSSDTHSTDNHVMLTAKKITKTMTSFGGSIVSSITTPLKNVNNNGIINNNNKTGLVTIVNIDPNLKYFSTNFKWNKNQPTTNLDYLAHFCAHKNSKIGHLMFGKGGQLLLTGSSSSTIFNVFLVHIHPKNSALSCIQHIYSLVRGNSTAKVISSVFSSDNRWVAISTNHGSTHLFAITPYGGRVTTRTHNGKFMNKESRFEKTAGIINRTTNCSNSGGSGGGGNNHQQVFRIHPGTKNSTLIRTVSNAHVSSYYVKPIVLCSSVLAKQALFSSESFCAWASDNTPNILQPSNGTRLHHKNDYNSKDVSPTTKRAVMFTDSLIDKQQQRPSIVSSLIMLEGDGILTQYGIDITNNLQNSNSINILKKSLSNDLPSDFERGSCNRKSCLSINDTRRISNSNNNNCNNVVINDSINNAKLVRMTEWELSRSNSTIDFEAVNPPLPQNNSFMKLFLKSKENNQIKQQEKNWLPFLEVITYSGPHRRLWLGPQFCFNVHTTSSTSSECTDEDSCESFISQVNGLKKCCPVLIEREHQQHHQMNGFIKSNEEMVVAKIVCGSWSSEIDSKSMDGISGKLKEKIDEAMRDLNLSEEMV